MRFSQLLAATERNALLEALNHRIENAVQQIALVLDQNALFVDTLG